MEEESGIYAKLESPLFGTLVQTVELAASAVSAPLAAARIFNAPTYAPNVYVSAGPLRTGKHQQRVLEAWPSSSPSLFDAIRRQGPAEATFRPRELLDSYSDDQKVLYAMLEALCPIRDAACVPLNLNGTVWAVAAFLRCEKQPHFTDAELDTLERMRPAMTRALRQGFDRELSRKHPTAAEVVGAGHPMGTHELIQRLSQTERAVLHLLRAQLTERQIAERMGRSRHTVHVHVKSIYRKLGVRSRQQLIDLFVDVRA